MRKLSFTSPGMLLICAVIAASGICLFDLFCLHPLVDAQKWGALRERAAQTQHIVELALHDHEQALLSTVSVIANCEVMRAGIDPDSPSQLPQELPYSSYEPIGFDLAWLTLPDGEVVSAWRPSSGDGSAPVPAASDLQSLQAGLPGRVNSERRTGLVQVPNGQAVFARCDVTAAGDADKVIGQLWAVQYLDSGFLVKLGSLVRGRIDLVVSDTLPQGHHQIEQSSVSMHTQADNLLVAAWPLYDSSGEMFGYFRAELPSAGIYTQAVVARRIMLIVLSLSGGLTLLVILGIHVLVAGPVIRLLRRLAQIEPGDESSQDLTRKLHGEPLMLARQLESAFDRLATMSRTDQLTNLANRRHLKQVLETFYQHARRYNRSLSLMMIDIDFFKAINDTGGHQAGDKLLLLIGEVLSETCRQTDLPARVGGDEFCILLPETAAHEAIVMAERIRKAISSTVVKVKSLELNTTASVGITDLNSGQISSADDVLAAADDALYVAKRLGRNRVVQAHDVDELNHAGGTAESDKVESLSRELAGLDGKFKEAVIRGLEELVEVMVHRDVHMADHARQVKYYVGLIAREIKLPQRVVKHVEVAAMLHDIGMSALPDDVLLCPGALNEDQVRIMRRHPLLGVRIMESMEFLEHEIPAVRYHHEHYDGSGYPDGIAGADIPLTARILSVADAFAAMTSTRTFRQSKTVDESLDEIERLAGIQFDPVVVEAMLSVARRLGPEMIVESKAGGDGASAYFEPVEAQNAGR